MDRELIFLEVPGTLLLGHIELFEKSSLGKLEQNIIRAFPTTTKRQYATDLVKVTGHNYTAFPGVNSLMVRSVTRGSTGKVYNQVVMFAGVEYQDEDTNDNVTFKATNQKEYHIAPISMTNNNVNVRCTCLDFYYRFSLWNFQDGSLFGRKPKAYHRKTDTYPSVNPEKVPGLCKHLLKLAGSMEQSTMLAL